LIQPGKDVIVDPPEVVTRVVFAEVCEVDSVPVSLRPMLTAESPDETVWAVELEALQPRHE
jgi:hypothetical protein